MSNNLINLGVREEVKNVLASYGKSLAEVEASIDESGVTCSHCINEMKEFARFNFGLPTLTANQLGAIMTGRLNEVLKLYKTRAASATGSTKDFYNYQIIKIERIFND